MSLPYEVRKGYACKVCGNVPDDDGMIEHGRGCYTQSSDGGGFSFVDLPTDHMPMTPAERAAEKQAVADLTIKAAERVLYAAKDWKYMTAIDRDVLFVAEQAKHYAEYEPVVRELVEALLGMLDITEHMKANAIDHARAVLAKHAPVGS